MTTNVEPRASSMGIAGLFGPVRGILNDSPSTLREFAAGIVVAALTLPLCVAAGILAFAPLGREFAASGAFAGVYCAAIGGLAAACVRRSSFVTTIPTTPIAVIQASFVASALADAAGDRTLVLLAIPVCVFCAGLWQLLFAASGFSRVVHGRS